MRQADFSFAMISNITHQLITSHDNINFEPKRPNKVASVLITRGAIFLKYINVSQ